MDAHARKISARFLDGVFRDREGLSIARIADRSREVDSSPRRALQEQQSIATNRTINFEVN